MIYYIFILLAVLAFTLQFVLTKLFSAAARTGGVTALCMLLAIGLAGALVALAASGFSLHLSGASLLLAAIFAAIMIPYHTLGVKALALGELTVYSIFMMLGGMLLPFLYGILLLNEGATVGKLCGCVLLTLGIALQGTCQSKGKSGQRAGAAYLILCCIIFIVNGLTGIVSQIHALRTDTVDEISFIFFSSLFTAVFAITGLIPLLIRGGAKAREECKSFFAPKPFLLATMLGAMMNVGNYLILLAAPHVGASIQFPLISGGTILASAAASLLIFGERPTKKELWALLIILLSTVLFAF